MTDDSLIHDGDDDSREVEYTVCDNLFNIPPDRFLHLICILKFGIIDDSLFFAKLVLPSTTVWLLVGVVLMAPKRLFTVEDDDLQTSIQDHLREPLMQECKKRSGGG